MRYLLFCFPCFEAAGGWNDYAGCFEDVQQAKDEAERLDKAGDRTVEMAHIVDMETGEIVHHAKRKLSRGPLLPDGPIEWKDGPEP